MAERPRMASHQCYPTRTGRDQSRWLGAHDENAQPKAMPWESAFLAWPSALTARMLPSPANPHSWSCGNWILCRWRPLPRTLRPTFSLTWHFRRRPLFLGRHRRSSRSVAGRRGETRPRGAAVSRGCCARRRPRRQWAPPDSGGPGWPPDVMERRSGAVHRPAPGGARWRHT